MKTNLLSLVLLAMLGLAGCSQSPSSTFQGYVEGEFVYVAAPLGGTLANLAVSRGAEVQAGQLLFELEREAEAAAVREAEERLAQAGARLSNLRKGRRPTEIAALEAQLERAQASLRLSKLNLDRLTKLSQERVASRAELDATQAQHDADRAQAAALEADLQTARLGAREDEVKAAAADQQAATAALAKARWAWAQKSQTAPATGRVHDTLYRVGEFVAAGAPVVSMLPPENIKVRFFVPQSLLGAISPGRAVSVSLDGSPTPLAATVSYISTQAEFTPPVIYSKENRAKLVFMVEAAFSPADARNLKPGQPADVSLGGR